MGYPAGMEEQQVHQDLMNDFLEMLGEGYTSCRKVAKFLRRMNRLLGPYMQRVSGTLGSACWWLVRAKLYV